MANYAPFHKYLQILKIFLVKAECSSYSIPKWLNFKRMSHFLEFQMDCYRYTFYVISPYSVRMRENTDQNNSEYGNFLRSVL